MTTTIQNLNINYIEASPAAPAEELVVMLHGWGAKAELFEPLISLISQKYRVLAPNMPGFGGSQEPPEPWSVDRYADFILDFLAPYAPKKVIFIGHSFGGRVIIKLSSRNLPFEISKIILIDSAGIKPKKTLRQKLSLAAYKVGKAVLSFPPIKALFPDALENLRKKRGSADYQSATPIMRQTLVKVVNEDLSHLLSGISASTLLFWGTADTATPLSDALLMEKLIPDAGLVRVEGAGHFSFLEAPELCRRVVASFLKIDI